MNTEARYLAKCRTCKRSISALGPKDANGLADRFRSPGTQLHSAHDVTRTALVWDEAGLSGCGGAALRCSCGRWCQASRVLGRISPRHVCGARCLASTSGKCECSCGGKNHGAGHTL